MLTGAHSIIYSTRPEKDRAFLRDILKLPHVDVGEGWLIFALPPSEVAIHPSRKNNLHELYFMCADVEQFVKQMEKHRIRCGPVTDMGWGRLVQMKLPGGGELGVYEPRHARPAAIKAPRKRPAGARKGSKPGKARKTAR